MSYFLVNGCQPIICSDIGYAKFLHRTDDVIKITKKQYENILSEYILYTKRLQNIIKNINN